MCGQSAGGMQNTQAYSNVGIGLTALGTIMGTRAQDTAANAAAQQASVNAALARQQSLQAGMAAGQQAGMAREKGAAVAGAQRAAYGASGIDSTAGTALDVQAGTIGQAEQDAQTIRYNAMLQQWGFGQEAKQYEQQARDVRTQAKYSKTATLLSGLTNIGKMYAGYAGTKQI